MRFSSLIRLRLRSLFSRAQVEQALEEELRYHLDRQIEENIAGGMSREEAERRAMQSVHGFEQRKEECRDMRGLNLIDNLRKDIWFAIRQLEKNHGFACTAIFVLALGVCASVAIFAFVDAALIKPLPYRNPARLVGVFETNAMARRSKLSYLDYVDWKKLNHVFSSLDAYQSDGFMLRTASGAQPAKGSRNNN